MYGNESDTTEDDPTLSSARPGTKKSAATNVTAPTPNLPPPPPQEPAVLSPPSAPPRTTITAPTRTVSIGHADETDSPPTFPLQPPRQAIRSSELNEMMAESSSTEPSQVGLDTDDYDDGALEVEGTNFIAVYKFEAEQTGDLSVEIGDEVALIATRSDGWWRCRKQTGEVGLLPKNVLKHLSPRIAAAQNRSAEQSTHVQQQTRNTATAAAESCGSASTTSAAAAENVQP
jgi:hypothetical protein